MVSASFGRPVEQRGSAATEYALVLVLIAVAIIVGAGALGIKSAGLFQDNCNSVASTNGSSC